MEELNLAIQIYERTTGEKYEKGHWRVPDDIRELQALVDYWHVNPPAMGEEEWEDQ